MNARVSPDLDASAAFSRPLVRIVIVGHVDHGKSVELRCGAVAVGRTYLFPPLSSGGALLDRP